MELIGIVIVIIGFALKFDTIAVVLVAGLSTGLVAHMSLYEILEKLGSTFVSQRHMTLFILTLPVIGVCDLNKEYEKYVNWKAFKLLFIY